MAEDELGFGLIDHWAEYFEISRMEILHAAINGRVGLYFRLDDCFTADLPNPNPGYSLAGVHLRAAYLQADEVTLRSIKGTGVALTVQEAYTANVGSAYAGWPKAGKVQVWRSPIRKMSTAIDLRLTDLFAIGAHVKALMTPQLAPAIAPSATEVEPTVLADTETQPSKLSERKKADIVRLYDRGHGMSVNQLAIEFGIHRKTIDRYLVQANVKTDPKRTAGTKSQ